MLSQNGGSSLEVQEYLDKFYNKVDGVSSKVSSPYNDIDYWHSKRTFEDFREFIDNFKSRSAVKREKKHSLKETDDHKGKLVGHIEDYEIWFVGSHEAAKQLGRFYKGVSAAWSTSVDSDYFWNNSYKNDTFYFLIRESSVGDEFDKLAFQFRMNGLQIWDLKNRKGTYDDEEVICYMKDNFKWIDKVTDDIKYFRTPGVKIVQNDDGTVNVIGSIYLDEQDLDALPWIEKYDVRELFGSLYINGNRLTTLNGVPKIIHGDFIATGNKFSSLDGMPEVEGFSEV